MRILILFSIMMLCVPAVHAQEKESSKTNEDAALEAFVCDRSVEADKTESTCKWLSIYGPWIPAERYGTRDNPYMPYGPEGRNLTYGECKNLQRNWPWLHAQIDTKKYLRRTRCTLVIRMKKDA